MNHLDLEALDFINIQQKSKDRVKVFAPLFPPTFLGRKVGKRTFIRPAAHSG